MSPGDREPSHSDVPKPCHNLTNPFVTFKKFADEQFTSLINRAFGTNPFILNPAVSYQAFKKDYEAWLDECRANDGVLDPSVQHDMSHSRGSAEHDAEWRRCPYISATGNDHPESEIRDIFSFLGNGAPQEAKRTLLTPAAVRSLESEVDSTRPQEPSFVSERLRMLNALISAREPYLYRQSEADDASFTILEDVSHEQPSTYEHDDWDRNADLRFSRPCHTSKQPTTRRHDREKRLPDSELDLIRGLGDCAITSSSEQRLTEDDASSAPGNSQIVSTTTTTHRVTLPDGRVISKSVLKNRFADGREESSESHHVERRPAVDTTQSIILAAEKAQRQQESATSVDRPRTKGWFWN